MAATVYYSPRTTGSSPSKSSAMSPCAAEDGLGIFLPRSWPMSHPIQYVIPSANSSLTGISRRNPSLTGIQRKVPRPLSMPSQHFQVHANALAKLESYGLDASDEVPEQQMRLSPMQPTRVNSATVTTPTPTCVPWISNVKAIKKIQSKIGIGSEEKGMTSNLSPLRFHSVHGDNIQLLQGGIGVRRVSSLSHSYCKAIVFSDRPVKVNERICVKVTGTSTEFAGGIRFGFTNQDPNTLRYSLPDRAIPELAKRQGFWAKALLGDNILKNEAILFYYVNHSGKVRYGINGKKVGTFFKYVDTRKPLWALLDVYGNTTGIELVDPKAHLNNSRKSLEESRNFEEVDSAIGPSMNSLILTPTEVQIPSGILEQPSFNNLQIHPTCGRNVQFNKFRNVAWRNPEEIGNAYVFTSRPIEIGETIVVQVHQSDEPFRGSMAFGLTSADPESLNPKSLPEDSYYLVDRPEYWIFKKDVVPNSTHTRDELAFTLTSTGVITLSENRGPVSTIMYVDLTSPLYAFFDLYGSTYKISLLGSILPRQPLEVGTQMRSKSQRSLYPQTPSMTRSPHFPSSPSRLSVKQSSAHVPVNSMQSPTRPAPVNTVHSPTRQPQPFQPGRSPCSSPSAKLTAMASSTARIQTPEKLQFKTSYETPTKSNVVRAVGEERDEVVYSAPYDCKSKDKSEAERTNSNWTVDCVACCRKPVNSLFSPCGHLTMCYDCAYDYWNARPGTCCPICRKQIVDVVPISKTS